MFLACSTSWIELKFLNNPELHVMIIIFLLNILELQLCVLLLKLFKYIQNGFQFNFEITLCYADNIICNEEKLSKKKKSEVKAFSLVLSDCSMCLCWSVHKTVHFWSVTVLRLFINHYILLSHALQSSHVALHTVTLCRTFQLLTLNSCSNVQPASIKQPPSRWPQRSSRLRILHGGNSHTQTSIWIYKLVSLNCLCK